MDVLEGLLAASLVTGGQIDEEGSVVEGGVGVVEGEVADCVELGK